MIKFEERFVHCFWNDELEGKKGFVADTLADLRSYVEDKAISYIVELSSSGNENYQFTYYGDNEITSDYQFCYYDPLYEMKIAYEKGKTIQYFPIGGEFWVDCENEPTWDIYRKYRIKPEKESKEDKYVPFENTQEFIEAWEKKYPTNKDRPNGTMPLIWIASKELKNNISLITDFGDYGISTSCFVMSFNDLFEKYTFADGSVCGKKEE